MIVNGFRTALDLDTYPFSNFIHPWWAEWAKPGRGKPVLIMHIILAFSLVFTLYLSNAVVPPKLPHYFQCPCSTEAVGIAHKPPRVACSARIIVHKRTDKQTNKLTHKPSTVTLAAHAR